MTYKFNPTQHSTKIKAGLFRAKQAGKKLGRPTGGKIKGEDEVIRLYNREDVISDDGKEIFVDLDLICITYEGIAKKAGVSKSTVQKIINKYKRK